MQFNPLSVAKFVVSGVVGIGTRKIVTEFLKTNVPAPEKVIDKATIAVASTVISAMIVEATKGYTDEAIDRISDAGIKIVEMFKKSAALGRINRGESTFEAEGLDVLKFRRNAKNNAWEPIPTEDAEETPNDDHQTTMDTTNVS
jgi:hypothetical protein